MKHNKFAKVIEMILVSLPLIYVGGVGAYTIFNKNAKDSYSDNYVEKYSLVNSNSMYVVGNTYQVNYNSDSVSTTQGNFAVSDTDLYKFLNEGDDRIISSFAIINESYARINISFTNGDSFRVNNWNELYNNFYFTLKNSVSYLNGEFSHTDIFLITYQNDTLDNAFPYAMSEFNKLGFGKIDFVGWFVNIFMTGQTNNVYVQFINSYLNYFIFAEVCYFIPMIFYWFIHFGERVVDNFARKDY